MSRVPIHNVDSAPDAARPVLEAILAGPGSLGRVYSVAINAILMRRAGWTDKDVIAVRSGRFAAHPTLASLLAVVREAAVHDGTVDDAVWAEAIAAGWTVSQLVEAFVCIGLTLFVDHFVAFAQTTVDVPTDHVAA
jgi:hypothetical protein